MEPAEADKAADDAEESGWADSVCVGASASGVDVAEGRGNSEGSADRAGPDDSGITDDSDGSGSDGPADTGRREKLGGLRPDVAAA